LYLKSATVLVTISMWDVFYCVIAIGQGSESWDALLLLLCMVCTSFGAVYSFTPNLPLLLAYQYLLLSGPVLVNVCIRSPHHLMIATAIGALLLYITIQGKVLHTQFWNALSTQASLRAAKLEAESASEAKGAFVANMSHEIRTPLNGVLGMIAVVLESELPEEQRHQLELARHSGLLLQGILNDVLDISKIDAGKTVLESCDFDLKATLEEVVGLMMPEARQKGLHLSLGYPNDVPHWYRSDAGKIRQIVLNFVGNALKFTANGGIDVTVNSVPVSTGRVKLKIAVRDTGIGISTEQQARLFHKFSQADNSTTRKYGGTGLGLAICRRLAEIMGGTVGVISSPGEGSTFWASLPLPTADPLKTGVPQAMDDICSHRDWRGKVLVVEDNPINQTIACQLLMHRGLTVDTASDGGEAVAMVLKSCYSIVFMDCQMPGMDGYQATAEIRTHEERRSLPRTPIVAMTANAMAGDRELCLRTGMDDYLSKPLTVVELERVLSCWSRNAEMRQASQGVGLQVRQISA
jgi:signal transduction histidine kinase/FixJ family two-component response regulator